MTNKKQQLSEVDKQLQNYREMYKDVKLQTNLEIANTVCSIDGMKLLSITSIAQVDGEQITCAEITDPADVSFFSNETTQMKFKLSYTNLQKCLKSLSNSALAATSIEIDTAEKHIIIVVNTVINESDRAALTTQLAQ